MRLVWFGLFCFVPSGYAEILNSVGAGEWDGTLYLQRHRFLTESANSYALAAPPSRGGIEFVGERWLVGVRRRMCVVRGATGGVRTSTHARTVSEHTSIMHCDTERERETGR